MDVSLCELCVFAHNSEKNVLRSLLILPKVFEKLSHLQFFKADQHFP